VLDQSSNKTGFVIAKVNCVTYDYELLTYETKDFSKLGTFEERVVAIKNWMQEVIQTNKIELIILEDVYLDMYYNPKTKSRTPRNVSTYGKLNKLLGTLESYLVENRLLYQLVPAEKWRTECKPKVVVVKDDKTKPKGFQTQANREDKKHNTQLFVEQQFGFTDLNEDTCDALAIFHYCLKQIIPKITTKEN
jgi:hypothetical protein